MKQLHLESVKVASDNCLPPSKRAEKEKEVEDITLELKSLHGKNNYSEPQYRLWARMMINGLHSRKQTPPNVPMITGFTPTRGSRQSVEDTVASPVSAAVKAMAHSPVNPIAQSSTLQGIGVSPSKAVYIRGKCLSQLANLKQLFEDSVLTEEELKE